MVKTNVMIINKIPTAEKIAYDSKYNDGGLIHYKDASKLMIEFAKLHCRVQLEAILNDATVKHYDEHRQYNPYIDDRSIINAYPLENIK
jgi:hypothetical protein